MHGEVIGDEHLGGRSHGVLIRRGEAISYARGARTRRGARREYLDALDWLAVSPQRANAAPGDDLLLMRVEKRRVVDERHVRAPGEPPAHSGVREPRRPHPPADGAEAAERPPGG